MDRYMDRYKVLEPHKYGPFKACPFCGSAAKVMRPMGASTIGIRPPFYGEPYYRVICSKSGCFCSGPANSLFYLAVKAWNTRAPLPATDEQAFANEKVKALVEAIHDLQERCSELNEGRVCTIGNSALEAMEKDDD